MPQCFEDFILHTGCVFHLFGRPRGGVASDLGPTFVLHRFPAGIFPLTYTLYNPKSLLWCLEVFPRDFPPIVSTTSKSLREILVPILLLAFSALLHASDGQNSQFKRFHDASKQLEQHSPSLPFRKRFSKCLQRLLCLLDLLHPSP
jgi:hypothetical protein